MTQPFRLDRPRVRAVLGPTNTGKTHLAIDRMLGHDSGIIGFPLRLLARENYDRMVARKGAAAVALITGEEKIVPPGARWFACTVEAMPLDREVAFVAVDEIQLCADPDRGHIFTDRLLNARGFAETLFLGAETIAPLLRRLVPQADIETRPRLSRLTHAGITRLGRLPPRSAIVAFSATEVYAIAEAVRRKRGGCAVVMGRLSPRTRNAQVAMFQAKEVDFLVATDAIGMGLNMDVNHVAFASMRKFDGRQPRPLGAAEVAQIAGRAGRGMRDGTFGTIGGTDAIPPDTVEQVEDHRFDPLTSLVWRNSALEFHSLERLLSSLAMPPPQAVLRRGPDALDHLTLLALVREPAVRERLDRPPSLRLLWDVCCVPDFRKFGDDTHARFCARLFLSLVQPPHRVPTDLVARSLQELARQDGDIDTLMQRLAGIRVWAYVAARPEWLADSPHWQARTRDIEDSLSDALHERLTARFVDRRAAHLIRRLEHGEPELLAAVTAEGVVLVEGHRVGRVDGFTFTADADTPGEAQRHLLRAARRTMGQEMRRRLTQLDAARDVEFRIDPANRIGWRAPGMPEDPTQWAPIARLRPGPTATRPRIEPIDSEFTDDAARRRIAARLDAWFTAMVGEAFAPLWRARDAAASDPVLRGVLHLLEEGLGIVPADSVAAVAPNQQRRLRRFGILVGAFACWMPLLLKPRAMQLRVSLLAAQSGAPVAVLPGPGTVSIPADGSMPPGPALAHGWVSAGPLLLRLDIAERIVGDLTALAGAGPCALPRDLASRIGCRAALVPAVLRGLGFRVTPGAQGALVLRSRRRPPATRPRTADVQVNPVFAALTVLKR
jgi:ATP-dependent RNA helicase SUPV3L1/SUV3